MSKIFRKLVSGLALISIIACEEKYTPRQDDVRMIVINKTKRDLVKIWIRETSGTSSWYYLNITPEMSVGLTFNVKEHFNIPQGDVTITAYTSETDSLQLKAGSFTDYKYQGPAFSSYHVFENSIEIQ